MELKEIDIMNDYTEEPNLAFAVFEGREMVFVDFVRADAERYISERSIPVTIQVTNEDMKALLQWWHTEGDDHFMGSSSLHRILGSIVTGAD